VSIAMMEIIESFESDFKCLNRRQIRMMRVIADSELAGLDKPCSLQRRNQAQSSAEPAEKEGCLWRKAMDPAKLARDTVSRKANAEEVVVSSFMVVIATKAQLRTKTGRVNLRLQATQYILRYALQAISLLDSIREGIENGSEKALERDKFDYIFTSIRPVCTDLFYLHLWKELKETMVKHHVDRTFLQDLDIRIQSIFSSPP
ncbi:hypothetical protein PMAYCL1PPCAC_02058, partial [Pristionchus mayeri]